MPPHHRRTRPPGHPASHKEASSHNWHLVGTLAGPCHSYNSRSALLAKAQEGASRFNFLTCYSRSLFFKNNVLFVM